MSKKASWVMIAIFLAFISLFFVLNFILPDREFSEQENRYLKQAPKFSLSSLFSGKFTSEFETYTTDQFVFRDNWTTLKARSEIALGKSENNGIYLCKENSAGEGDTLIERFEAPDSVSLDTNVAALNALTDKVDIPVYFALIPGAAEIWKDKLPDNAPNDSQLDVIEYAYSASNAQNVDLYTTLNAHKDEYIFYRTDHHWTSRGAYYGYTGLMETMGLPYHNISHYDVKVASTEFYGTTWSSSGFSWVAPDRIETYVEQPADVVIKNFPNGLYTTGAGGEMVEISPTFGALYDESFLDKKDKYSMFMGGNTPLLQIKTGISDAPSLLIIRDSYMDSLTPFLLENFSEIHIIDLRYFKASIVDYIGAYALDNVLVCYSVANFCTDTNIFLLGR